MASLNTNFQKWALFCNIFPRGLIIELQFVIANDRERTNI